MLSWLMTEVIRGDSAGQRGRSHDAVIESVHEPVEDVSFFMGRLWYRLGQVELEEEIHYSSRGGVLGTVAVDTEVTKDHLQTMARIAVVK